MDDGSEIVRELELELAKDLKELKNEIEENDLLHGIPNKGMSSIHMAKDADFFKRERKFAMRRSLQVSEAKPIVFQADVMKEEMESCEKLEYTDKSLPLLVHQYYIDRMQELVISHHSHLLRWKRFSSHTEVIESIFPLYKKRIEHVTDEYLDSSLRAKRLASSREAFLCNNDQLGLEDIILEDILIYFRWLICHLHSLRSFNQFLKIIQWFSVAHRFDVSACLPKWFLEVSKAIDETDVDSVEDNDVYFNPRSQSVAVRFDSFADSSTIPNPPPAILTATTVHQHNPILPTAFNMNLAAAGVGSASYENTLGLPLHTNDINRLRAHLALYCDTYSINYNIENIKSSSDEMELYAAVNRKFRQVYLQQEILRTFKTYDCSQLKDDKWGMDCCSHALRKESNWIRYLKLKPRKHCATELKLSKLRATLDVDELLLAATKFSQLKDPLRVQDALRQHAQSVQNPSTVTSANFSSHRVGQATTSLWKKIYTDPQLYNNSVQDDESANKRRKRRDSFDFQATMQILGLNDTEQSSDDPSSVQGSYLSFLHLRNLKIRDLQRTCISFLNYFRSLERTITINDEGLILNSGEGERNYQNHRSSTENDGLQGGGGGIGSHAYMFNTPKDYKVYETEFMRCQEVENHDDYYTHEEGRIHVRDHNGYYIIYTAAEEDYKSLESEMLLIATHYIQKDVALRKENHFQRNLANSNPSNSSMYHEDSDIEQYSHVQVDRFGIVLDIWNCESMFLESKKQLIDCYMEAYINCVDRDERRKIAQIVISLIYRRPRFDFEQSYMISSYRLECSVLRLEQMLVKKILNSQIEEQRAYLHKINVTQENVSSSDIKYGLPFAVIEKLLVSSHSDRSELKSIFMLEFHPSLGIASRLQDAFQFAYHELLKLHQISCVAEEIQLERSMFEVMLKEWEEMDEMGISFSQQIQRDLFAIGFLDDPQLMCSLAHTFVEKIQNENTRDDKITRQRRLLTSMSRLFELVTLRHRLLDAAWESEVLSKIYRRQANEMGFDDCHLYMRFIQFDAAKRKETAENARPPANILDIFEDDTLVDKFQPSSLSLAIQEMDETHVGRFSFRNRDDIIALLEGNGVENLQVILKLQIVHKNAITSAVLQAYNCSFHTLDIGAVKALNEHSSSETRSEKSNLTATTYSARETVKGVSLIVPRSQLHSSTTSRYHPESFFSIQLEKSPSRDRMMNRFVAKTQSSSVLLKSHGEMEKAKRELMSGYCEDVVQRVYQCSMRAQILAYYGSILQMLNSLPNLCENYFQTGKCEKEQPKEASDNVDGMASEPRSLRFRPKRVLSRDGNVFMNLWFIPHYSELLMMFRDLDDVTCTLALRRSLNLVAALHDILQYLIGHASLGTFEAQGGSQIKKDKLTTDWGGTDGIGIKLSDIQRQIDNLHEPQNPDSVAELLLMCRNTMFLEFDVCVRNILRETFLAAGNMHAYQSITENIYFSLTELSSSDVRTLYSVRLNLPEPLEARDSEAALLMPWRTLINRHGPFLTMYWAWHRIEYNLQMCLAGLKDSDRYVVHGELLALSLSLEDVLHHGEASHEAGLKQTQNVTDRDEMLMLGKRVSEKNKSNYIQKSSSRSASRNEAGSVNSFIKDDSSISSSSLNRRGGAASMNESILMKKPIEAYQIIQSFLILCKRVDCLKYEWARRRLSIEEIESTSDYQSFCKIYKAEILYPLMRSLSMQYGQGEAYDQGPMADTDIFIIPKNIPDLIVRQRQLSKLVEVLECRMITETRRKIHKEMDLVLKERNREEGNLPTDLWKKSAIKSTISLKRPLLAEEYVNELMSLSEETDESVTFSKEHLNICLNHLCVNIMSSQRETYESYSMYYENLLQNHHEKLYKCKRELVDVQHQLHACEQATEVEVQLSMAERTHSLLLEITALRAQILEMREYGMNQEKNLRKEINSEYYGMVQNLLHIAFEEKRRVDEYRDFLHTTIVNKVSEVRNEAIKDMNRIKEGNGVAVSTMAELTARNQLISRKLATFERDYIHQRQLMTRMKAMSNWKETYSRCDFQRRVADLQREKDINHRKLTRLQMQMDEKTKLLDEEMLQLKSYLTSTHKELNDVRKKLDKEIKEKKEKKFFDQRKEKSEQQLKCISKSQTDKIINNLKNDNENLNLKKEDLQRNLKNFQSTSEKTFKEVDFLNQQLREERRLKGDAFEKVDHLLDQVHEYEYQLSRAQTSVGFTASLSAMSRGRPATGVANRSTSSIAGVNRSTRPATRMSSMSNSRPSTGAWPPMTIWPSKAITPELRIGDHDRKIRPKTVASQRLRSKIADQLLYNIEPDHHETMLQLKKAYESSNVGGNSSCAQHY